MYFPFYLLSNLYTSHFILGSMPYNTSKSRDSTNYILPSCSAWLSHLPGCDHALVLMCDKGNDSVLLHLQECRASYLQVHVGRGCGVQHWGCRGAVTVILIQGLSTHLCWMQLIHRWFFRHLLSLILKSTEDTSKMAAHYPNPLSRSQPAAYPFPASRLSWELACSFTQRMLFDLTETFPARAVCDLLDDIHLWLTQTLWS